MKVTYLQIHPGPQSGERLEIADIPDGILWMLAVHHRKGWIEKNTHYWKDGSVLRYKEYREDGVLKKEGSNSNWLQTSSPKNYVGEIV